MVWCGPWATMAQPGPTRGAGAEHTSSPAPWSSLSRTGNTSTSTRTTAGTRSLASPPTGSPQTGGGGGGQSTLIIDRFKAELFEF